MAAAQDTGTGLERLQHLAGVKIHQIAKFGSNKYVVYTIDGEVLFTMKEDGGILVCLCDGRNRDFDMDVVDRLGRKAFMIHRSKMFLSDEVKVSMGRHMLSVVRKVTTFWNPLFSVNDANDVPVLRVKGDFTNYNFELQTQDKTNIGSITKKYRGLLVELFSNADDYEITFPVDLDWRYKTAVIATCILIDYRYHEK